MRIFNFQEISLKAAYRDLSDGPRIRRSSSTNGAKGTTIEVPKDSASKKSTVTEPQSHSFMNFPHHHLSVKQKEKFMTPDSGGNGRRSGASEWQQRFV